jgi:ABC-type multidrug transport system permease subunit
LKAVRDTLLIAWMKFYPDIRRNPLMIIVLTIVGAMPLFFMRIFGGEDIFGHGLIGAMVSMVGFIGLVSAIQDVAWDRYIKIREMIVAMPVHPLSYIMGSALAALLYSIPAAALFMAIAIWYGILDLVSIFWIVPPLLLCWGSLTAVGFTISTYLRKISLYMLNSISMILSFLFVFLFPVYYPKEMLGDYAWISYLTPTSNTASLIRAYLNFSASSFQSIMADWTALMLTTVIFIILASMKARWRET